MTHSDAIAVIRAEGDHHDVGVQVGRATAQVVRRAVAFTAGQLPDGRTLDEQLALAGEYRRVTAASVPWLVDELDGVAAGAGVDPLALFAASIEEIWKARPSQAGGEAEHLVRGTQGRCSDLVATRPATADGHTWIAHTNDLPAASEPDLVAVEWRVPDEPVVFSIGIGPWISVGWNDRGIALSGNELTPNDERIGVPRLLMVREQLARPGFDDAVAATLRPDRASSYNTIVAGPDGRIVDIEGSATDAELVEPDAAGVLVHTNHYACERMRRYEGDDAYARRSQVRYERARQLLTRAAARPGSVTPEVLLGFLADHENGPDSICRHPDADHDTKTVFWAVTDVEGGIVRFGRGNPCRRGAAQEWAYAVPGSGQARA